ncbi:DUF5937 family protein [Arthrobacter sp. GMC3]|uniref:ArsR/SmtB family transcription factor n=1 Tax=Arthrobacter sp. GMC3 TaxID=2058894 RepID=UPI000CE3CABD|nr:DUF5937 family protein [Arthrobacter sp. GMC3]
MLHYELGNDGLSGIRFGISPLCEMGLSLRAVKDPSRYPLQLPWLSHTREARESLEMELLIGLVNDRLWTPDFLNPRPTSPLTRVEDEFTALAALSPALFIEQLENIHGLLPRTVTGSPRAAIRRMVTALREYWNCCFAPHWPRMRAILEADITHRGRVVAQAGMAEMLNDISPAVSFAGSRMDISLASVPENRTVEVAGRGVMLVPTMFTRGASAPVDPSEAPLILYPARGQGAMWETEHVVNPRAVAQLLGQTRASLLTALATPASSTELGFRFGVSTSAVNQHLRALKDVGLVTKTRYGHSMLYLRSPLGSALLGAGQHG